MSKSKHAPALFELISKPQKIDGVRARMPQPPLGESPAEALAEPRPDRAAETIDPPIRIAPVPVAVEETPRVAPTKWRLATILGDAWWRITGGRIQFSLSQRGATIALCVAGLLLILVHYLGYALGERRGRESALAAKPAAGATEIDEARKGPVTRKLFDGVGEDPTVTVPAAESVARAAPPASAPQAAAYEPPRAAWVKGHTYVVVQDFRKDAREDAVMAQDYLAQNSVPSAILELSGNYPYRLITKQGFNWDDQAQRKLADEYQERIRRLGRAYLQAGGRYDFKTYFKKLTDETW